MCFNKQVFDCVWQGEELTICYTGLLTPNHIRYTQLSQMVLSKKGMFLLTFLHGRMNYEDTKPYLSAFL